MKMMIQKRITISAISGICSVLLLALLCGCTAQTPPVTNENGLPPHVTAELRLPEMFEVGAETTFSLEAMKNGELLANADSAEFLFWPDGHKEAAVVVPAVEVAPGTYEAPYTAQEEGVYVVQSRVQASGEIVMPAKRFAIGTESVEQLIHLEESQKNDAHSSGGRHPH